ncbi:MAG: DegT/DnrJ/EryC1/StrS family aminotransferase [Candidatus Omnitrophota bacterium]
MMVKFIDLGLQYKQIEPEVCHMLDELFRKGDFILGEEVGLFEQEFSRYCRVKYAVGLNSGTDALFLSLLSLGIGKGDEVIVPAFTFIATAFAVSYTGARPVFVDIDEATYNIDINKIEGAITKRTKAIIPVHLFGQPADMDKILSIAKKHKLKVVEDAAQAHGAKYKGRPVGSLGDVGCFSFYPTKNLGACGDGGMVVTRSKTIYERLRIFRDCGRVSRYEHKIIGYNSRLDTLQAAILRLKLKRLDAWNKARRLAAALYTRLLKADHRIITPHEASYARHVYHIYAARLKDRDKVYRFLRKKGIGTLIHYPIPLHLQGAYIGLGYKKGDFPVAERVSQEILSLPIYPHLKSRQIKYITKNIKKIL